MGRYAVSGGYHSGRGEHVGGGKQRTEDRGRIGERDTHFTQGELANIPYTVMVQRSVMVHSVHTERPHTVMVQRSFSFCPY